MEVLKSIRNSIGIFIQVDSSFQSYDSFMVAYLLVEIDLKEGSVEDIRIEANGLMFVQPTSYMGIPFRTIRCHLYGHLANVCILKFTKKVEGKKP
jgi:hypothetical protein